MNLNNTLAAFEALDLPVSKLAPTLSAFLLFKAAHSHLLDQFQQNLPTTDPDELATIKLAFSQDLVPDLFHAVIRVSHNYEAESTHWECHFLTPQAAEQALAQEQAKIAPEEDWESGPNGNSTFNDNSSEFEGFIYKLNLF